MTQKHFNPMEQEPEKGRPVNTPSYFSKEVTFLDRSPKAVFVEWLDPSSRKRRAWIGRSTMRHDSEKLVDALKYGSKFTLTCFEWVAKKERLLG